MRYGLSRNTVVKWRARDMTHDAPMRPRAPSSTVLTVVGEAMIVWFRRRTLPARRAVRSQRGSADLLVAHDAERLDEPRALSP
jgi:hypothetical protein